jgi:hypothetical protein
VEGGPLGSELELSFGTGGRGNAVAIQNLLASKNKVASPPKQDGTATLKIALQNLKAAGQEKFVLFDDLVKPFDSVNREMLWLILAKMGLPTSLIRTMN